MDQLAGQVAVIFGGGSDIARGIAVRFGRERAKVVVADREQIAGEATVKAIQAQGAEARFVRADATVGGQAAQAVAATVDAFGRVDILVNAVETRTQPGAFESKSEDDFTKLLGGDVLAAVRAMQAVYPHMKKQRAGRIINVGSIYGANAHAHLADIATRDFALQGLTRGVGSEWAKDNVLVNYLSPGIPDTAEFQAYRRTRPAMVDHLIANTPLQRLMDPVEDIGGAAMYLVSDEACYIVGHPIYADGGQHLVAAVMEPGFQR
jgi:NAD(P)-dependent dehydrogenase (short-subunit alcohol dehydrogenase family)